MVPADRHPRRAHTPLPHGPVWGIGIVLTVAGLALSACGANDPAALRAPGTPPTAADADGGVARNATARPRLVLGQPEPGLSFKVTAEPGNRLATATTRASAGPSSASPSSPVSDPAPSAEAAAQAFADALVRGHSDAAFALLPTSERTRIGSPAKFADVLSRDPAWTAAAFDPKATDSTAANASPTALGQSEHAVALAVTQTPTVDEIFGVVAPSATVRLPARKEADGWKISWERRSVTQRYAASDDRVTGDVIAWATARQQCDQPAPPDEGTNTHPGEQPSGLFGAVWLVDALCPKAGATAVPPHATAVGDIYELADPQPLLDAYGSGAYQWARVVTLAAPNAMQVIAAPLDDRWIVVGVAPVPAST